MKKWMLQIVGVILFLSGCGLASESDEIALESEKEIQNQVTGNAGRDYLNYSVIPSSFSENRGLIINRMYNRQDMDEIETGLMTLSEEYFPSNKFRYEEGQFLTEIPQWLARKSDDELGLNPAIEVTESMNWKDRIAAEKENPNYLAYIHEQNYIDKDGKLQGISISLAMNSVDYIRIIDKEGLTHFDEESITTKELRKQGEEMAEIVVNRMRSMEALADVPIVISLFKLLEQNSVVPGNHLQYAFVNSGENSIRGWENLNQKYYYFPSSDGEKQDRAIYKRLLDLEDFVSQYFTYQDVEFVGKGLYEGEDLQKLVIDVSTQLVKESEVIGFTQVLTPEVMDYFPHIPVYMYVTSPEGIKATIVKEIDEEPFVHIHK